MSEFFKEEEEKAYIPPDYSPSEDDDDEDEVGYDCEDDDDEGAEETILDKELKNKEKDKEVTTTPFGEPATTPSWGSNSGTSWGSGNTPSWGQNNNGGNFWGSKPASGTPWGSSNAWGNTGTTQKQEINREKQIIFIDFLDCIAETYQSNGQPGLLPRDIYDLKPRFDVWTKLAAFNPERIYMIIPKNLLTSTNGIDGWRCTMEYFCCSVSSFVRIPYTFCQVLAQNRVGQPKGEIMASVIENPRYPLPKDKIISIGIYSGLYGQNNRDKVAADFCGIDHLDLNQLLNNMY